MKTCFTCNMGSYDDIKPPKIISEGWEYVLFSNKFEDIPPWQCVVTKKPNREIKIKADDMFPHLTLYVDGSIEIIGDLNKFIKEVPNVLTAHQHPHRNRVAQECSAVIKLKGCNADQVWRQMERYGEYKDDMLAQCGVLLRDLNNPTVRKINSHWYNEFINGVPRDQLSFIYSCKKHGIEPYLFSQDIFNKYFILRPHL